MRPSNGCLRDGWRVVGIDRNAASIDGAEMLVGDAGDEPMLAAALKICGGSLDALVCSAGIPPSGPWESREHWDEVIAVDLAAPYEALRVCMPALVAARGSAVLVGSIVGAVEGSLRSPAYAAAKAGLEGLARSMAVIGAPDGVRVNVVAPGAIATDFDERLLPADHRTDVPLGRMGTRRRGGRRHRLPASARRVLRHRRRLDRRRRTDVLSVDRRFGANSPVRRRVATLTSAHRPYRLRHPMSQKWFYG